MIVNECLETQYRLLANIYDGRPVEICAYDEEGIQISIGNPALKAGEKSMICSCEHPEKCPMMRSNLFDMSVFKPGDLEPLKTRQKVVLYIEGVPFCPIVDGHYFRITVCHANDLYRHRNGYFMICEDITEERLKSIRLKHADRNMNMALEAGNVIPWRYDFATDELTMHFSGIEKKFKLETMKKVVHPDDLDEALEVIEQMRSGQREQAKKSVRFYSSKREQYRYLEGRMITDYDEQGNIIGILGTQHDITEEALVRKKLERNKQNTLLLNQVCRIVQWSFDPQTLMLHTEGRGDSSQGTDYFLEDYLKDFVHPDDRHFYWDYLKDGNYLKNPNYELHIRMLVDDFSDYRYVVINCVTHFDSDSGRPVILGIRRDETEEKWRQKQIEDSNERLKYVMRLGNVLPLEWNVSRGLFRLEYPETQSFMPPTFRKFGEWVDFDFIINSIHPDEREKIKEYWKEMSSGEKNEMKFKLRYDSNHVYENTFELHLVVAEKDMKTNLPMRIVGYLLDITEHELLLQRLMDERFKAEESNRLKSAFLANISHEIRTPLNAIVGFSNLLADGDTENDNNESHKEYAEIIEENSGLLLDLVDRVIELSRIEAGKVQRMPEVFCVNDLFYMAYSSLRMQNKKPHIDFILDIPQEPLEVNLDRRRMNEVLNNFVSNAFKYTESGSVRMGYRLSGGKLHIFVQDTGCGISPENRMKVFQRFEKLGSLKQGAGLGMSICMAYVEEVHGQIGVDSEVGEGSTFWVDVPL